MSETPLEDLLRPDLWELALPALQAARRAGREHVASGRYAPRLNVTRYYQNDAGWPQVTADRFGLGPSDGPIDWSQLFGFQPGTFTYVLVSDVPDLAAAVRKICLRALEDDELLSGLCLLAAAYEGEELREQLEFSTLRRFIGTILNRADAVGAETEDELRSIYVQIERSRFAKNLTGDVLIPLVAVSFESDQPFHIDGNVWIERLTEADHRSRAMSWMTQGGVSPYVASAATHAVVLRDVEFANCVHTWRSGGDLPPELSGDLARTVAEAVHIVTELATGYAQVLVRPRDWADGWMHDLPPLWTAWSGRAYPEELNGRRWVDTMNPIGADHTDEIARIAKALRTAPKNVQIAARRCRRTTFRDDAEDMVLDAAIGIEAMVGKEPDALTHRMAQRAALALASDFPPSNIYTMLKQFYVLRSKIAHGDTPKRWMVKLGDTEFNGVRTGQFLLRMLLRSWLLAEKPWDATSLDALMLENFERSDGYLSSGDEENQS